MRRIYLLIFAVLLVVLPKSVFADSGVMISCNNSKNIAGEVLSCNVLSMVDEELDYDSITATVSSGGGASIEFVAANSFISELKNDKLTITSQSNVGSSSLGTLHVTFPRSVSGSNSITLSNIKFYKEGKEVAVANNATTNVEVTSSINTLKSLTVTDCNDCKMYPAFKENITFYTLSTDSDSINIEAVANGNAKVRGTGIKNLELNSETFEITVISEAGTVNTYNIIVSKKGKVSTDNTLQSITLSEGVLDKEFSSDIANYKATVNSDKINILAIANDLKAKITGDGEKELEYGENLFEIVVTAEDGNTKSYFLTIIRSGDTNNYLEKLTVNGISVNNFDKEVLDYKYDLVGSVDSLDILAIPEVLTSTVEIVGNKDFKLGENIITILVTSKLGEEKEYVLKVNKQEPFRSEEQQIVIDGYDIDFYSDVLEYDVTIGDEERLDISTYFGEEYTVSILGNEDLQDGSVIEIIVDYDDSSITYKININKENEDIDEELEDVVEKTNVDDINYIPIIMTSLLIVLAITDSILLVKRLTRK